MKKKYIDAFDIGANNDDTCYSSKIAFPTEYIDEDRVNLVLNSIVDQYAEMIAFALDKYVNKTKFCREIRCEHYCLSQHLDFLEGTNKVTANFHTCPHLDRVSCPYYLEKTVMEQE